MAQAAKAHGICELTIYSWRQRFGGIGSSDVKWLKQLEQENGRLKKLLAERDFFIEVFKELNAKKW